MPFYEGKIEKIGIFVLKDSMMNQYNKDKTHRVSIIVDGFDKFISVGDIAKKDGFDLTWRRKVGEEYVDVYEGAEVEFMYDVNKAGYWNIRIKSFNIKKNGDKYPDSYAFFNNKNGTKNRAEHTSSTPSTSSTPQNSTSSFKKDMSGVETGHSINCGFILNNYIDTSLDTKVSKESFKNLILLSKWCHDVTKELKEKYSEINTKKSLNMSDYDIGAMVGHAVLNSCRLITKDNLIKNHENDEIFVKNTLRTFSDFIMEMIVPQIQNYIKFPEKYEKNPEQKSENGKNLAEKSPEKGGKNEKSKENCAEDKSINFDDFDEDDIPF